MYNSLLVFMICFVHRMSGKKRKGGSLGKPYTIQPSFSKDEWPPTTSDGWKVQYSLRIAPNLNNLVHHHPDELVELIHWAIAKGGNDVKNEVTTLLRQQLPNYVPYDKVVNYIPNGEREESYMKRLVLNVNNLQHAHPFDLFLIIFKLVKSSRFPEITEAKVVAQTQYICKRQSELRGLIRK